MAERFFHSLPTNRIAGTQLSLPTCLSQTNGQRRLSVVLAYWNLQNRSAASRILASQTTALQDMSTALAGGSPQDSALQASAKAALLKVSAAESDAEAERVAAQCALLLQIGKPVSNQNVELTTLPYVDKYPTGSFSGETSLRRLTALLQAESGLVDIHADAVTASDQLVQASLGQCRSGQASSAALDIIDEQAETSLRFVAATIVYNQNIAEFAARTSTGDRFVATLMVH